MAFPASLTTRSDIKKKEKGQKVRGKQQNLQPREREQKDIVFEKPRRHDADRCVFAFSFLSFISAFLIEVWCHWWPRPRCVKLRRVDSELNKISDAPAQCEFVAFVCWCLCLCVVVRLHFVLPLVLSIWQWTTALTPHYLSPFVVQAPFCCEGPHLSLFVFISPPVTSCNLCFPTPEFQTLSWYMQHPPPPSSYLPLHSHISRSRLCFASLPLPYLPISSTSPCHSHSI